MRRESGEARKESDGKTEKDVDGAASELRELAYRQGHTGHTDGSTQGKRRAKDDRQRGNIMIYNEDCLTANGVGGYHRTRVNHTSSLYRKGLYYKSTTYTGRYPVDLKYFKVVPPKDRLHPTEKPVELLEYLIKTYTDEGDIVLDNACGSGSTLLAAKNTNRHYIGFEIDKEFYKKAKKRLCNF